MKFVVLILFSAAIALLDVAAHAQVPVYHYLEGQTYQYHIHATTRRLATGERVRAYTVDADVGVKVTESLDSGEAIVAVTMGNVVADYSSDATYSPMVFIPRSQVRINRFGHVESVWILDDVPKTDEREYAARRKCKPYDAVMSALRYVLVEIPAFTAGTNEMHTSNVDSTAKGVISTDKVSRFAEDAGRFTVTSTRHITNSAVHSDSKSTLEIKTIPQTGYPDKSTIEGELHQDGYVTEYKVEVHRTN